MPSNSSSCAALSVLPLTRRDNGVIAAALAPLMVLIVNVAAPKPAMAQEGEETVATRTFVASQDEPPVRADVDMAADMAMVRLADARRRPCLRIDTALPPLPAVIAAAGARARPALMREPIVGAASMYNPLADDKPSGGEQTASGEIYDALAWTAAIQIGLRGRFGGVRYGREYRDAYALVESGDRRAIVKINDVGPLRPGRVIDFNERTMRYFDASLEVGVVPNVRITPLDGDDWTPGPVEHDNVVLAASAESARSPRAQILAAVN